MISCLSSFIEFMAAIYVTMSIDNLITKRFWTRDYASVLSSLFIKFRVPYISRVSMNGTDDFEDLQKSEELLARRRGLLMLTACVSLLVYIGFEPKTNLMSFRDVAYTYFSLDITYIFLLLAFFLDHIFLSNDLAVTLSILSVPGTFFLSEVIKEYYSFDNLSYTWASILSMTPLFTVFVLLAPALWQLTRNWLYSHINMIRIQHLLFAELEALEKAQHYSKDGDINSIAERYQNDVKEFMCSNETEDILSGHLIESFSDQLRLILKRPRVRDIIPFMFYQPLSEPYIVNEPTYNESVDDSFNSICIEYDKMKKRPPLDEFARIKQVDPTDLRYYYSNWLLKRNSSYKSS